MGVVGSVLDCVDGDPMVKKALDDRSNAGVMLVLDHEPRTEQEVVELLFRLRPEDYLVNCRKPRFQCILTARKRYTISVHPHTGDYAGQSAMHLHTGNRWGQFKPEEIDSRLPEIQSDIDRINASLTPLMDEDAQFRREASEVRDHEKRCRDRAVTLKRSLHHAQAKAGQDDDDDEESEEGGEVERKRHWIQRKGRTVAGALPECRLQCLSLVRQLSSHIKGIAPIREKRGEHTKAADRTRDLSRRHNRLVTEQTHVDRNLKTIQQVKLKYIDKAVGSEDEGMEAIDACLQDQAILDECKLEPGFAHLSDPATVPKPGEWEGVVLPIVRLDREVVRLKGILEATGNEGAEDLVRYEGIEQSFKDEASTFYASAAEEYEGRANLIEQFLQWYRRAQPICQKVSKSLGLLMSQFQVTGRVLMNEAQFLGQGTSMPALERIALEHKTNKDTLQEMRDCEPSVDAGVVPLPPWMDSARHAELTLTDLGLSLETNFRKDATSTVGRSGGENSVSSLCMSAAAHCVCEFPFRVVDEINQGMDHKNESMVHDVMLGTACQEREEGMVHPQYFIGTPKLPCDLKWDKEGDYLPARVHVLCKDAFNMDLGKKAGVDVFSWLNNSLVESSRDAPSPSPRKAHPRQRLTQTDIRQHVTTGKKRGRE
ncbi:structural maintenance of chromosomes protein 5 [Kipferlia bialata]|uniref:Structural maintenance of chromosomes protein 5 n=1 Tax=Kipferlia bialata TaxID=797122 RepID=A0A9K3GGY9_9EUKA|nr:structural maintenance of chromosomes protein 5 [Kipferlia bialata]GIQ81791.1 structural maintenance of chromosomes protein 5 [Kipferlia bialata]GIQ82307.1 structural maintenance of chromosomes protein 5 [Kipferlia bialata]|eukprot:g524.t1